MFQASKGEKSMSPGEGLEEHLASAEDALMISELLLTLASPNGAHSPRTLYYFYTRVTCTPEQAQCRISTGNSTLRMLSARLS